MLRRQLTWILATFIILLLVGGGGLSSLALWEPFAPGEPLYPLQLWVEQTRLLLITDQTNLAERLLDIIELRLQDLDYRVNSPHELAALTELDEAINRAVVAIDNVPREAQPRLRTRLASLAARYQNLLKRLTLVPRANPEVYAQAVFKAASLLALTRRAEDAATQLASVAAVGLQDGVANPDPIATATPTPAIIAAHPVPFPPNATAGPHDFFPLTGRHAALACGDCHANGNYRGTTKLCADCHNMKKPANHFPGACDACHTTTAWKPANFNHTGFTDCVSCHTRNKPADHYAGQCSLCHATTAWKPANFNHTGFTDCVSCHTRNKPANHYEGQCSLCHTTTAWTPANFNHSVIGNADCATCHQPPANHWPGACKNCHGDTANWKNARFDHGLIGGQDCISCHQAPANHWSTPCARCHGDTGNFKHVTFDHGVIGSADCNACHQPPANHWPAPCTRCHSDTAKWKNARFDHSVIGNTDCSACHASRVPPNHFGGPCSACHKDTGNWKNATFDHGTIGGTDCAACHQPPANHFPGACRDCHTDTGNWKNASFNHTFPLKHHGATCASCHAGGYGSWSCDSCHAPDKMANKHKEVPGYDGNCLKCHADGRKP
jgi:hypothetical protein